MKRIKYFNKELKKNKLELVPLEYLCKNEEFEYWLDVIKKSYGEHGEVTFADVEDIKTEGEIEKETFTQTLAQLTIDNKKKDLMIASLVETVANLTIKINQKGSV